MRFKLPRWVALANWLTFSVHLIADCHPPPAGATDAWRKCFVDRVRGSVQVDRLVVTPGHAHAIHVRTDVEFQCLRVTGIRHVEISAVNVVTQCREKGITGVGYL